MKLIAASLFTLWSTTITVNSFAFAPRSNGNQLMKNMPFKTTSSSHVSQTRLYETIEEEEVNTLLRSATIYGDKVADENIR